MIHLQEVLYDGVTESTADTFIAGVKLQNGSTVTFTGSIAGHIGVSDESHLTLTGVGNNNLIEVDETSTLTLAGVLNQPTFEMRGQATIGGVCHEPSATQVALPPNTTVALGTIFNIESGTWQVQNSGLVQIFNHLNAREEPVQLDSMGGVESEDTAHLGDNAHLIHLSKLAAALEGADDMERLSRPLLEALQDLTGLATTYLTVIQDDVQEVKYVRNTRTDFTLQEGLQAPWQDTVCSRALNDKKYTTPNASLTWPDNSIAKMFGLKGYASVPVETSDGKVWGTLCAADNETREDLDAHLPTMKLFARLIAAQVEREAVVAVARKEAATDPLTACSTRRVVEPWLTAQMESLKPDEIVLVIFTDLDEFKLVNDTLGHRAGDAVLVQVGEHLRNIARPEDLVARFGGDEFLVAARLPRASADAMIDRVRTALSFNMAWLDSTVEVRGSIGAVTSDDYDAQGLVGAADALMYEDKRLH